MFGANFTVCQKPCKWLISLDMVGSAIATGAFHMVLNYSAVADIFVANHTAVLNKVFF